MKPARQVSLAGLLGLVAVAAVGLASLKYATVVWTSIAATLTLGLLLAAVLGAVFLRGKDRGFWAGFALFGIAYLTMVNWSGVGGQTGHGLTGGLSELAEWVHPEPPRTLAPAPGVRATPPENMAFWPSERYEEAQRRYIRLGNFVSIGRYALCLAFALVGGLVGRHFAAEGARASETSEPVASSAQGR
jgi:hypothetical protein